MKKSWSHIIFLDINRSAGQYPLLDKTMRFLAVWAIYILTGLLVVWSFFTIFFHTKSVWFEFLGTSVLAFVLGLAVSAFLGLIHPAKRPKDALPGSVELITLRPFEYWKSFPSDHTMTAFTLVFVAMSFGLSPLVAILFLLFALAISCSRVYVGVHFPRDIFGGIVLAAVTTIMSQIFVVSLQNFFSSVS